jgi:hypothetical protein
LEDSLPLDLIMRADPADPLLVGVAEHAVAGELIMGQAVRRERAGRPLVTLMRSLLLLRARPQQGSPVGDISRLSIRTPVLAGVSRVVRRPASWAESLLGAVDQSALLGLTACLRELRAN